MIEFFEMATKSFWRFIGVLIIISVLCETAIEMTKIIIQYFIRKDKYLSDRYMPGSYQTDQFKK